MKKILTVQDISCFGKCSITIALPVISAMGVETVILPTAVLSTHTMFSGFTCKDLTDQWKAHGVEEGTGYATLTDIIYYTWAGLTAREYKHLKGLRQENLRDNMTDTESALTTLAEVATREISQNEDPETIAHSINIARRVGGVAKVARDALEDQLGRSIISSENAKTLNASESPKEIEEQ